MPVRINYISLNGTKCSRLRCNDVEYDGIKLDDNYYLFKEPFTITTAVTYATASDDNATEMEEDDIVTLTFSAYYGYNLPETITVVGATLDSWDSSTGTAVISNPTRNVTVTVEAELAETVTVIGFTGLINESGELTWTDDIADLNDSDAYTTEEDGNYVSVTGALDNVFPYSKLETYTDPDGNVFTKFPRMYIKWVKSGNYVNGIQITNVQTDGYFCPDCFLNPDASGDYNDCFYMGRYEGSGSTSLVYSVTGKSPLVSVTIGQSRAACRAYGTSSDYYGGYQQLDGSMNTLYNFLCMLFYRKSNIQNVYVGRTSGTGGTSWSSASVTGTTDGVSGLNGWNTSTDCVKMLGVENPYGNVYEWVDGIYRYNTGLTSSPSFTTYVGRYPMEYQEIRVSPYVSIGFKLPISSNYISFLCAGTGTTTQSIVLPYDINGSSSTYCGDYYTLNASYSSICKGGDYNDTTNAGLWTTLPLGSGNSTVGCRLCLRPIS